MTYIIAELGSVHDGSLGNALRLIEECAGLGADAVKLQCHTGETIKGDPPWFVGHETREGYLSRTGFNPDQWRMFRRRCTELQVDLVVSPFSVRAVQLLEELPVDAYKIASGQVTNLPMLEAIRATGRRVFVSCGMGSRLEEAQACEALGGLGRDDVTLMQCTSVYPAPPEQVGLNIVAQGATHRAARGLGPMGFSDHTLGFAASLAAIALGATVIERHVCFDRRGYGSDCQHSLTLDELAHFVREVRSLDLMLANPVNKDELAASPAMQQMRAAFLEQP